MIPYIYCHWANNNNIITFKRHTACFSVLQVETTPLLEASGTTRHGIQIPSITSNHSATNGILLSLTISDDLKENELYSVNFITINDNGEGNTTGNIQFSTYINTTYYY